MGLDNLSKYKEYIVEGRDYITVVIFNDKYNMNNIYKIMHCSLPFYTKDHNITNWQSSSYC